MSGETPLVPWGFQRWSAEGWGGHIAAGNLQKHNKPLEASLFRLACGFINHAAQRRTERGQVRQYGAWETPCPSPKNGGFNKAAHHDFSTSRTINTAGLHTQVKVAPCIVYPRCVYG